MTQKDMIFTPQPVGAQRLNLRINALLANTGQAMPVARQDILPWLLKATDPLAATSGGRFWCLLGDCEMLINRTRGGALIRLRQKQRPVGLALLAWRSILEGFMWSELVRARDEGHQRHPLQESGLTGLRRPALPWLGVVLWGPFLRAIDARGACHAESIFWAAAHGILRQVERQGRGTDAWLVHLWGPRTGIE